MSTATPSDVTTPPPGRYQPPPRRRVGRLIAVVIGALLVFGGAVALVNVLTSDTSVTTETFADVTELTIDGQVGDVDVVATDRGDVVVETEVTDSLFASAGATAEADGNRLELVSSCDRWWLLGTDCSVDYVVEVPAETLQQVTVDLTAADVTLNGLAATVDARTTAGEIDLTQFRGPAATLETTAGSVTVDAVEPAGFDIRTTAGEIDVTVPDDVYRVEADTTAGDIDIDVRQDPSATHTIDASTTAGEITISRR